MWTGNPARFVRKLTEEQKKHLEHSAAEYVELGQKSAAEIQEEFGEKFRCD